MSKFLWIVATLLVIGLVMMRLIGRKGARCDAVDAGGLARRGTATAPTCSECGARLPGLGAARCPTCGEHI